ncbi:hypothetical protein ABEB22_18420 (plasmid) [Thioclava sp. 'Guangxiensis']|uniref:hypothetical protein n=1 Tax=Thioclava sp. 'Guangxiensis' TaxID=3149044 RepID=UPI0032C42457
MRADHLAPYVTDHALVRYMERVMGLDLAAVRAEIEARVAMAVSLGATATRQDGFRFVLDGPRVITIMTVAGDQLFVPHFLQEPEDG